MILFICPFSLTLQIDELDVEDDGVEGAPQLLAVRRQEVLLLGPARRQQLHAAAHEGQALAGHVAAAGGHLDLCGGHVGVVTVARGQLQKSGKNEEEVNS